MELLKKSFFKILRFAGIFAIIYASLLFYMLLSERRLAFPRAEADKAAEDILRDEAVMCITDDGKRLQGWILNDSLPNTVLYFADGGEDAATFLANTKGSLAFRFVAFNYRGSAGSEGNPGETHYKSDIRAMIGCAHAENPLFLGHGTGSIAAYNSLTQGLGQAAILVDPAESFNSSLSSRYRIFFPAFLGRTRAKMDFQNATTAPAIIIANDPRKKENLQKLLENHAGKFKVVERKGQNFLEVLRAALSGMITK